MQNYCKTIGALAAASALVAGNAQAEVEYQLATEYASNYIFRGAELGENLVDMTFDAAYTSGELTVSGGVWAAAFENSPVGTANQVENEVDWYAEVGYDFGFANLSIGYIYYWNLGQLGHDAQEVPFTISRDFGFANLYLTYFMNVDGPKAADADSDYVEVGGSKSWELNSCLSVSLNSNVGYLVDPEEFTSWTTKVALDWGFAENATVSPFIAASVQLNDLAGYEDEIVGGSMLSVKF